ncbi:hypothetical protein V494_05371 [Pseudogymnoascus sp. VKM F-4513 (FW-928)]|nr:hypothetical protein V494_05371 [Pseudogymnoascus sp. VKM F-4513 (FW-928)]
MSAIIAAVKIPENMSDALHTPSALVSPGHVSWYRYVGLSTGKTVLSCADSALKVGTHDTYRNPWIITSPNRVYAVAMWNVRVVDTDSEKKDASALCRAHGEEGDEDGEPGVPNCDVEAGLEGEEPLSAGGGVAVVVGTEGEGDGEGEGDDERGCKGV